MRSRSWILIAVVLVGLGSAEPVRARSFSEPRVPVRVRLLPLGFLARPWFGSRAHAAATEPAAIALKRVDGWQVVGFDARDWGSGVYLEVEGRAQFDRAEVVFSDGELQALDLRSCVRSGGLFELADFGAPRQLLCVRLRACARSREAGLRLRLGR